MTLQARTITTQWHAEFNLPIKIYEPKHEVTIIWGDWYRGKYR